VGAGWREAKIAVRTNCAFFHLHRSWQQIKAKYAAGIGLKEIACNMNIIQGTVLAMAKREGWTQQIEAAKQAIALSQPDAISPLQSRR
jgi:hypothetical protein